MPAALRLLAELETKKAHFGDGCADRKFELLRQLDHQKLPTAAAVTRLHEVPGGARCVRQQRFQHVRSGPPAFAAGKHVQTAYYIV